jgi:hypothetical protein
VGGEQKLTIEGQGVCENLKIMNLEPHPKVELGFIPSKNPKTRFVDGALVGVRSFKAQKNKGNLTWHEIFFPLNQAMNILGG